MKPGALCSLILISALLPNLSNAADVSENSWYQAGREAVAKARQQLPPRGRAHNVILFIGDGMGVPTVTAARILEGQQQGQPGEEHVLSFERFPWLALAKTYNTNQQVPDSAGTMTAMVTGVKTGAGILSLDETARRGDVTRVAESRIPTLFEQAEARGLATGLVTTTRVTHATPAALYAHSPDRDWESDAKLPEAARRAGFPDIALQMIDFPSGTEPKGPSKGLDVVLGGGRAVFVPPKKRGRAATGETWSRSGRPAIPPEVSRAAARSYWRSIRKTPHRSSASFRRRTWISKPTALRARSTSRHLPR